jgi:hypothetical protein
MDKLHYKGKGEHSVKGLELIIEQQVEELHLLNSRQKQLNMHDVVVSSLFDEKGKCINDKETYFDKDGDLIEWFLISCEYDKFPVKSDIVKIYYAENYAGETHGNYCARTLFSRGY